MEHIIILMEIYIKANLKNNKDGNRIYFYTNRDIYKGEFKIDLKKGYGIIILSNNLRYKGEFKNNLRDGYGICYYPNQGRYEGEFKKGKLSRYIILNLIKFLKLGTLTKIIKFFIVCFALSSYQFN